MIGIVAYGYYIPNKRITVDEIANVWKKNKDDIESSLNIKEKAIAGYDEDVCTMAIEASRMAINEFNIEPKKIGAILVGSESHPYAVKPTGTILSAAVNANERLFCADLEFACKAGTAALQLCYALVKADLIEYGLACGSDTAQAMPNDALEFTASSGAASFIVGKKNKEVIANIKHTVSYTTDTPDFWRRQHAEFPRHAGRFTGEPAYFKHIINAAKILMEETNSRASDFDYAVFHQPNGKFPIRVAKALGFDFEKIKQGLLTPIIGNTYSAATVLGLCSILDIAKPNERILVVSYGSGAGSDAFDIRVTRNIEKRRPKNKLMGMVNEKEYVSYADYIRYRKKLKTF